MSASGVGGLPAGQGPEGLSAHRARSRPGPRGAGRTGPGVPAVRRAGSTQAMAGPRRSGITEAPSGPGAPPVPLRARVATRVRVETNDPSCG